jgi:hypothetical protein
MAEERPAEPPIEKQPAADLLPDVYAELRRLAGALSGRLQPGQTLQPTALVHEAYLRLLGDKDSGWEGRRHFFGAAARAMREILIEQARRKATYKHGGASRRVELSEGLAIIAPPADDLLALDEAIQRLQAEKRPGSWERSHPHAPENTTMTEQPDDRVEALFDRAAALPPAVVGFVADVTDTARKIVRSVPRLLSRKLAIKVGEAHFEAGRVAVDRGATAGQEPTRCENKV